MVILVRVKATIVDLEPTSGYWGKGGSNKDKSLTNFWLLALG